ncbi:MAG: Xaa-Pro dipeptidase [Proteobacteria bacterium]|nr:Xaa-Pro dipeptidase [Pseudomonadota bacterium]
MDQTLKDLYIKHLAHVDLEWQATLQRTGFDAVVLAAGTSQRYFMDDQSAPFKANPHLARWLPTDLLEHSMLIVTGDGQPRLFFYQPADYWHLPPSVPDWITLPTEVHSDIETLHAAAATLLGKRSRVALIGAQTQTNLPVDAINPADLIADLDWDRARKTAFEIACMTQATEQGVTGHIAARAAFQAGCSEFEIHMAYLQASSQTAADLPYSNIVALNEHAGVLHYQFYDREAPARHRSFLIDAGGRHHNYAADITRTYAAAGETDFAALIDAVDQAQQQILALIRPGLSYLHLHETMHHFIARILIDAGLANGSPEALFACGATRAFLPHGLGHLLGLQTHDVGGQQGDRQGTLVPPPAEYPALRLTRTIEPDQIFTIEPGLYFIPMLLDQLKSSQAGANITWDGIAKMLSCGGIRIEDNVVVTADGHTNLTRQAFARHG